MGACELLKKKYIFVILAIIIFAAALSQAESGGRTIYVSGITGNDTTGNGTA